MKKEKCNTNGSHTLTVVARGGLKGSGIHEEFGRVSRRISLVSDGLGPLCYTKHFPFRCDPMPQMGGR